MMGHGKRFFAPYGTRAFCMVGLGNLGIRGRKRAGHIGVCALKQSNRRRKSLIHRSGAQTTIESFPREGVAPSGVDLLWGCHFGTTFYFED
jgi:hypothetical protein